MRNGSQDAESRRNVPVWGYKMKNWNLTLIYPHNTKNLVLNRQFPAKMLKHEIQVYQKVLNQSRWRFNTMLGILYRVSGCNTMTLRQIQYGGRPPYWKSSFGYIWTINCLTRNFIRRSIITLKTQITWPKYSGSRHLNRDNKAANKNVKKLQFIYNL